MEKARFKGKEKILIQFLLTASAINLKKMATMMGIDRRKQGFIKLISVITKFILNICNQKQDITPYGICI